MLASTSKQPETAGDHSYENQAASAALENIDSCGNQWMPIPNMPLSAWKDAIKSLEKPLRREYPQQANQISLWFLPLQPEQIDQQGETVRLRFPCTSQRRQDALVELLPAIETLLQDHLFPGRHVMIELVARYDQPVRIPPDVSIYTQQPTEAAHTARLIPASAEQPTHAPQSPTPTPAPDQSPLDQLRQRIGMDISDENLRTVLTRLQEVDPQAFQAVENEMQGNRSNASKKHKKALDANAISPLRDIRLEPSYATSYDSLVRDQSAIYLYAYFIRHLRHMGPADALRYLALWQIAYLHGMRDLSGSQMLLTTAVEISRWSTLNRKYITGGLDNPDSYLYLLAGKASYFDYYQGRPATTRWEDGAGYHWKVNGREFCVWKKNGECSQLIKDRATGEPQWRQAPMVYRINLSMPLCPEDEISLRSALLAFGVKEDPIRAIQQCLAISPDELIPDRPQKISPLPRKLFTVQELVMETWGQPGSHEAAKVMVQAKILEDHLIQQRSVLKIPHYLIEKWGNFLTPAQLWTVIILMDRVFTNKGDEYRDTTRVSGGLKEITLWTDDEYSRGAMRKVSKWLAPYSDDEIFNPWFSVFASEVGERFKNPDNTIGLNLRVLPMVPLCPSDTLGFVSKMGMTRLAIRDCAGQHMAVEITDHEVAVYLADGRTLRYDHSGTLIHGDPAPIHLKVHNRALDGLELLSSEQFYESETWPSALFLDLESGAGALFSGMENQSSALSSDLESRSSVLFSDLENKAFALFSDLTLEASALFPVLLKLLILNLYWTKKNSLEEEPPSAQAQPENVDSLELFGSRQGHFIQWTEVSPEMDWEFTGLAASLGIADTKSLMENQVSPEIMLATALELYTIPVSKFTSGRISVLVSKLRADSKRKPDGYLRLADIGPLALQDYFRRAILNVSTRLNDPDWDSSLGQIRRDDLIELAEKLGLARVYRSGA